MDRKLLTPDWANTASASEAMIKAISTSSNVKPPAFLSRVEKIRGPDLLSIMKAGCAPRLAPMVPLAPFVDQPPGSWMPGLRATSGADASWLEMEPLPE